MLNLSKAFTIQQLEGGVIPALSDMTLLRLPPFLTVIESEAFSGIAAEAVIIPDGCQSIESGAFKDCERLLYIRIPTGVTIPEDAFVNCPLAVIDQQ